MSSGTERLHNLVVDLSGERFNADARGRAFPLREGVDDACLAWIDETFGGAWSSEACCGTTFVAMHGGEYAGFATVEARAIGYRWLRGLACEPGVGLFGPFGVAPAFRGEGLGADLLIAALNELRARGFERALIAAVGDALVPYYARVCGAQIAETFDRAALQGPSPRTAVLASGNGSNFQAVADAVACGELNLRLTVLLSNRADAYALERARTAGIEACALPWNRAAQTRAQYDASLRGTLARYEPEMVLLLGWMHLLDDAFVGAFSEMINIHPAFLPLDQTRDDVTFPDGSATPAFRGAHAVRDALHWGSRWTGASAHRVTLDTDRGPVLVRAPLEIAEGEEEDAIFARLHPLEHRVLRSAIRRRLYERP